jgi:hypothetical protein
LEAGTSRNICNLETRPYEKSLFVGQDAGSRPILSLGTADDIVEETGESTRCTAGARDPASKERFSEITSGSVRLNPGKGEEM